MEGWAAWGARTRLSEPPRLAWNGAPPPRRPHACCPRARRLSAPSPTSPTSIGCTSPSRRACVWVDGVLVDGVCGRACGRGGALGAPPPPPPGPVLRMMAQHLAPLRPLTTLPPSPHNPPAWLPCRWPSTSSPRPPPAPPPSSSSTWRGGAPRWAPSTLHLPPRVGSTPPLSRCLSTGWWWWTRQVGGAVGGGVGVVNEVGGWLGRWVGGWLGGWVGGGGAQVPPHP